MIVVSDTTPLNYLILIELIHILPQIFTRVYAPSAVVKELSHPRAPELVRAWATVPPEWLTIQDPTRIDPSLKLGAGETAAISLAIEMKADRILIDERKGRRASLERGLRAIATLNVLEEASYRGLIDFEAAIERLDKGTTFYVTEDVLAEYRRRVGEHQQARDQQRKPRGPAG